MHYTLQYCRARSFRWRVAKAYDTEREEFRVVEHVMHSLAKSHPRLAFRIILQPGNVLAASASSLQSTPSGCITAPTEGHPA